MAAAQQEEARDATSKATSSAPLPAPEHVGTREEGVSAAPNQEISNLWTGTHNPAAQHARRVRKRHLVAPAPHRCHNRGRLRACWTGWSFAHGFVCCLGASCTPELAAKPNVEKPDLSDLRAPATSNKCPIFHQLSLFSLRVIVERTVVLLRVLATNAVVFAARRSVCVPSICEAAL